MKLFTKFFEKIPATTRRHGDKVYKYGYVWLLLPRDYVGCSAVVKVYITEEWSPGPPRPPLQFRGPPVLRPLRF